MELLALWPLLIIIILVMYVLYLHTKSIKERIKYKSFNAIALIYDMLIYVINFVMIGFFVSHIYSIYRI